MIKTILLIAVIVFVTLELWKAFNQTSNVFHNPKNENGSGSIAAIEYAPEITIANKNSKEQVAPELQSGSGFT